MYLPMLLEYNTKKSDFVKVQVGEKSARKKMEVAAKIWQDAKAHIEYVLQSKGFSSVIKISWHLNYLSNGFYWVGEDLVASILSCQQQIGLFILYECIIIPLSSVGRLLGLADLS